MNSRKIVKMFLLALRNLIIQTFVAVVEICAEGVALSFPEGVGGVVVLKNKTKDFVDSFCLKRLLCFFYQTAGNSLTAKIRMHTHVMNDCPPSIVTSENYAYKLFARKSAKAGCRISFYITVNSFAAVVYRI